MKKSIPYRSRWRENLSRRSRHDGLPNDRRDARRREINAVPAEESLHLCPSKHPPEKSRQNRALAFAALTADYILAPLGEPSC